MRILFTLIFLSLTISNYSQNKITGSIYDETNNPINNGNVLLLSAKDSILIKGSITNPKGYFEFNDIKSGEYIISISFVGYKTLKHPLFLNSDINLEKLILEINTQNLNEVVLVSKKPLFELKLDKIVVNVQENLVFAGGTALEVLSRSPGVNISKERNTISLNGKNEVLIMLDGKISRIPMDALIQMLDGMPAQNIQTIELINNPGAKYDAGSTGGIINIVGLKGKNDGTNGSASLISGWGGRERLGATANLNHRKNKINIYSNLAYYRNHNDQIYFIERRINNGGAVYNNNLSSDRDPLSNYYTGKFGLDYDLSKTLKIGGFVSGMMDIFYLKANTKVTNDNNGVVNFLDVTNEEKNNWSNLTNNLYLNKQIGKNQELNFDVSYLYYYNTNNLNNLNKYYNVSNSLIQTEKINGKKNAPVNAWVGTIDYSNKLSEKSKIEFGLKLSTAFYNNDISVLKENINNPKLTQIFKLNENIYASYGNYNFKFSEKHELQTGLRYEYFDLNSSSLNGDITRKSGDLFPSIFYSYKFNDKHSLQTSYNRRVSRPSYNDFAPYYVFIDPSTSFTGNQELNQSIIDGCKIDYKFSKYLFSFQYSHENNGIARFQPQADLINNTLYFSSINMAFRDTYTILFSIPIKLASWWNIQNNIMGVKQVFKTQHLIDNVLFDNNYIQLNSTFSFDLPKKYSLELSGFYHTSQLYGFSRNREFGNGNIALAKAFGDKNKLRLTINNVLGTYKDWDIVDDNRLNYYFNAQYNFTPFMVRLTYTYTFGGSSSVVRKKGAGTDDIENRIR